jgi:Zn-dependent M28 family amino/carboxypeptidase
VVIGAHVDHIGRGEDLSSRSEQAGEIHFGADDNASGVAALLEIAQDLAAQKAAGRLDLAHDILFAAWTGEELGRLGSSHFVKAFAEGEAGLAPRVVAYLNLDMVGRLDEALYVQAVGSSPLWKGRARAAQRPCRPAPAAAGGQLPAHRHHLLLPAGHPRADRLHRGPRGLQHPARHG